MNNNYDQNSNQEAVPEAPRLRFRKPNTAVPSLPAGRTAPTELGEAGKGGESGPPTPTPTPTPINAPIVTNAEFVSIAMQNVPEGATAVVCSKPGDPSVGGGWAAQRAVDVDALCPSNCNNYLNCSSLVPDPKGQLRAKKEQFAALHVLVLDDVGTKIDRAKLGGFKPTWEIETSPGNFQVGIRLREPITNPAEAEGLQAAVVSAGLADPGAKGIVSWVRLPSAINGKEKYRSNEAEPFHCRLAVWNAEVALTPEQLAVELGLHERPSNTIRPTAPSVLHQDLEQGDDVYTPKPAESPVVAALKARSLYKREIEPGKHDVTCPWLHEHTDQLDTGAAYFDPNEAYPVGGYCCQHSHREEYKIGKLLEHLGLSRSQARFNNRIRVVPGDMNRVALAAEKVLAKRGEHYQSGGIIVTIGRNPSTRDISMEPTTEQALTSALSAEADWEKIDRSGKWVRCDPPTRHVNMLHRAQTYRFLPVLRGLARQPFFREDDGQLVTVPGYDVQSGRFGSFDASNFALPEPTREAAEAAMELLLGLLDEFCFASDTDKAAAMSAIFTAVVRASLELAPGFHASAPSMGTGKSYLCAVISAFAGPGESLRVSFPTTSEEATKVILSLLQQAPAVIEFDDMDRDWKPHGVLNRMVTSGSITDRILGVSKVATLSTRTLLLGSGNNVGPEGDLRRRIITIRLDPRTSSPASLEYNERPLAALRSDRGRYVAAVLTVIRAWEAAGSAKSDVPNVASFGDKWAHYCRHPLLWMGLADPALVLLEQVREDPIADSLGGLLSEWHKAFGSQALAVRKVIKFSQTSAGEDLLEALQDLPFADRGEINKAKLGWFLRKNVDRRVTGLVLRRVPEGDRTAWRVERTGEQQRPEPPLPPSPALPPSEGLPGRGRDAFD